MLINRDIEYAVLGLIALGKKWPKIQNIKDLSTTAKVPKSFLSKIFQKLSQAKIVKHKTGPNGGFILSKNPKKITMSEIFLAVNKNFFTDCLDFRSNHCKEKKCSLRKSLSSAENLLINFFKKESLYKLLK